MTVRNQSRGGTPTREELTLAGPIGGAIFGVAGLALVGVVGVVGVALVGIVVALPLPDDPVMAAAGQPHLEAVGASLPPLDAAAADRHVFHRALMGTEFRIVLASPSADSAAAREAAGTAFAHIAELERILSDYDPESELSRLADTAGEGRAVAVSDDLWAVLSTAQEWSERTGGAFDVTVGPLTRLWRRAARRGSIPAAQEVEAARVAVGHEGLDLDPAHRTVRLVDRGMRLDVGGIGKGYAADAALDHLRALGFPAALVDAGGDIVAGAPPPGENGWQIELPEGSFPTESSAMGSSAMGSSAMGSSATGSSATGSSPTEPSACVMALAHAAVATSGAGERSVDLDGVLHSHVLDPRTGASLTHGRVVTVLAPTATEADVLASALSVLSATEGRALVRSTPGVAARILEPDRDSWRGPLPVDRTRLHFPNCGSDHET